MDMTAYQPILDLIVTSAAVSLPLAIACGLVGRAYNALIGMVTGDKKVKL